MEESPMKVLLVESNPKALQRSLEKKGFNVHAAQNGKDADQKARTGDYCVIVLERELASDDALALLKKWRGEGLDTHILLLSAGGALQDKIDAFSLGADDYLMKPYQQDELVARLRVASRGRAQGASNILKIFDLEIDQTTRAVKRAGRVVDLTPREFELLMFLVSHRGKAVSRTLIWDQLYDENEERKSNVIDVYIRYLRKKIDEASTLPLILTCWGQGYMLRGDMNVDGEQL